MPTAAWAQTTPSEPPQLFVDLIASVTKSDFHIDSRYPNQGIVPGYSYCASSNESGCKEVVADWKSVIVANRGKGVVQEIRLLSYADDTSAAQGVLAFNSEEFAFAKHPYRIWRVGTSVIVVESRWRWTKQREALTNRAEKYLCGKYLAELAPSTGCVSQR